MDKYPNIPDSHIRDTFHNLYQYTYKLLNYNSAILGFANSSSILTNSFNLAILSPPAAPVLIIGALNATAKCAIVSSVVSPDLCDTIGTYLLDFANWIVLYVSVKVPIWLGLIIRELPAFFAIPSANILALVTNKSSPQIKQSFPDFLVTSANASKSFSCIGSYT